MQDIAIEASYPGFQRNGAFKFSELQIGTKFQRRYCVTDDVYTRFISLFGDVSPLHVSDEAAKACGFARRLVHGATLNGFISNFVGMCFPGRRSLELSVSIEYVQPVYIEDEVSITATVKERLEALNVVVLKFAFDREGTVVARGKISIKICDVPDG